MKTVKCSQEGYAALQRSIDVWEGKKTKAQDNLKRGYDILKDVHIGVASCPLCALFHDIDCIGCPIAIDNEQSWCIGSPYPVFENDFADIEISNFDAEIDYLKDLLERTETDSLLSFQEFIGSSEYDTVHNILTYAGYLTIERFDKGYRLQLPTSGHLSSNLSDLEKLLYKYYAEENS